MLKINATGMDQKEIEMNYLWIKQVSGIIYILENIFWSNLLILFNLWAVGPVRLMQPVSAHKLGQAPRRVHRAVRPALN